MKKLKTITLCDGGDQPIVSLCPGHVSGREFDRAFKAEGWSGDSVGNQIEHGWWLKRSDGQFERVTSETKLDRKNKNCTARPFTASYW